MELLWLGAVLLVLPGAWGDCQGVPRFDYAEPAGPTNTSYPVGASLRYKCRPGYTGATGKSPMVTCLPNSTWSADPDFCIGKSCGIPEIANGKFHYTTDLRFGATINFTCNFGYRLVGESTAQCVLADNNVFWNNIPHCEIIPCGPPPVIENGQPNSMQTDYIFGSSVTYSCFKGFSLIGDATIHCTADDKSNGVWSGPAPTCKEVRCQNPEVKNGKKLTSFVGEYTYGDTVTFECVPGYVLNGSHTVTCGADNDWKPPLPTCELREECTTPTIENGFVNAKNFLLGTTVTFSCDAGYELKGSSSAKCVASGHGVDWDVALPSCKRQQPDVLCGEPPAIDNGMHNGTTGADFAEGSIVVYKCSDGFTLAGGDSIHCTVEDQYRGVWSTPTPECKRDSPPVQQPSVFCGEPPAIDNGRHNGTTGTAFAQGSVVVYTCENGFTLAGGSSIQCTVKYQNRGVWSTPTPECRGGANTIIAGILPLLLAMLIMNF